MTVSVRTFEELALANPRLELHRGVIREKPPMALGHNRPMNRLGQLLATQLDPQRYWVNTNSGHLKRVEGSNSYVPDVCVIPVDVIPEDADPWAGLEMYAAPLPLVVEVWSPSTGEYDVDDKIPEYRARGDAEIWLLHPRERTLRVWRRQDDGSYVEETYTGGVVRLHALPEVTIDLDDLFSWRPASGSQHPRRGGRPRRRNGRNPS